MSFNRRAQKQLKTPLTLAEAKKKLMDLVARRDHSEKELRQKLALRCEAEVVEGAITWAREQNWLISPEKLTSQFAEQLGRRGKGIRKINQKLKDLGLAAVKADRDTEIEKARRLVAAKWNSADFSGLDFKESQKLRARILRYLVTRGYEFDVASLILKTEFKSTPTNEDMNYDDEF